MQVTIGIGDTFARVRDGFWLGRRGHGLNVTGTFEEFVGVAECVWVNPEDVAKLENVSTLRC